MGTNKLLPLGGDSGVIPKDKLRRGLYAAGSYKVDYTTWNEDSFSTKINTINADWLDDGGSSIGSVYTFSCYSSTGVLVATTTHLHTFTLPTANDLTSIPASWQAGKSQAESKFTAGTNETPETVHFIADGTKVVYVAQSGDVYLTTLASAYDIDSNATSSVRVYDHSEYSDFLSAPAYATFNSDGSKFVILDDDGYWWGWDTASAFVLPELLSSTFTKEFFGPSTSYSNYRGFMSPDGKRAFCIEPNTDRVRYNYDEFDTGFTFNSVTVRTQDSYFTSDITYPHYIGFTHDGLQYFAGGTTAMRVYSVVEEYKVISAWYPEINLGDFDATGDFIWILDRNGASQGTYFYARKNGVGFEGFLGSGYNGFTHPYDMLVVGAKGNRLRINKTKYTSLAWSSGSTVDWMAFAASPGFMDLQFRTGNASNSTNFHSLGYAPDLIWCVYQYSSNTYTYVRNLNPGAGGDTYGHAQLWSTTESKNTSYFHTQATDEAYYVGTSSNVNGNGYKYCDVLFTFSAPYFGAAGNETIGEILTWQGDGSGSKILATPSSGTPPRFAFTSQSNTSTRAYGGVQKIMGGSWLFYADASNSDSENIEWGSQGLSMKNDGFNWGNTQSTSTAGGLWNRNSSDWNQNTYRYSVVMLPEPPAPSDVQYVQRFETPSYVNTYTTWYTPTDIVTGGDILNGQHNNQNVIFRIVRKKGTPTAGSLYHANPMSTRWNRIDSQASSTSVYTSEYNYRVTLVQSFKSEFQGSYMWEFKGIPGAIEAFSFYGNGQSNRDIPHPIGNGPEALLLTDVQSSNPQSTDMRMYWYYGGFQNGYATGQAAKAGGSVQTSSTPDMDIDYSTGYMRSYSTSTTNYSSVMYAGVLFKTLAGVLKVGAYNGNNGTQNIDCGFSGNKPSALLIRDATANDSTTRDSKHYLFTADGIKSSGVSGYGESLFTSPGTHSWLCPAGVTSVSVLCVGGGGGGAGVAAYGGGGGALMYRNNVSVTPGTTYTVVVGAGGVGENWSSNPPAAAGGDSYFDSATNKAGGGGSGMNTTGNRGAGGVRTGGDGGGNGGDSGYGGRTNGGGGAGGYSGNGGSGGDASTANVFVTGGNGAGGGGGAGGSQPMSGYYSNNAHAGGGGVGLYGEGSSGVGGVGGSASTAPQGGTGGSGGGDGTPLQVSTALPTSNNGNDSNGGLYGGGGGGSGNSGSDGWAGQPGAVRIVWPGNVRSFPSTNVVQDDSDQGFAINSTTDAVVTGDCLGTYTGGFQIKSESSFSLNTSGRRYVFIAWA